MNRVEQNEEWFIRNKKVIDWINDKFMSETYRLNTISDWHDYMWDTKLIGSNGDAYIYYDNNGDIDIVEEIIIEFKLHRKKEWENEY